MEKIIKSSLARARVEQVLATLNDCVSGRRQILRWALAIGVTPICIIGACKAGTAEAHKFFIAITNRKIELHQQTLRVKQGSVIEIAFTGDEPAELHLHGYDKLVAVRPGETTTLRLTAEIAGRFPFEAHAFDASQETRRRRSSHVVLLYLEVWPPNLLHD
jgi:hypothetical protein